MNPRLYEEINNPNKWRPRMGAPLSETDLARFQLGLNRIFGLALDNSPNVRIVWGQDYEQTKTFNRYSGDWYPRYLSHVLEEAGQDQFGQPTFSAQYVAAPRYVIEGRVSMPENAAAFAETGVEKLAVVLCTNCGEAFNEQNGKCPKCNGVQSKQQIISSESYTAAFGECWEELLRILDHDHIDPQQSDCCKWNAEQGYECNGYFRLPVASDLKYLDAKWRQMQAVFRTAPDQARTPEEKQRLLQSRMRDLTEQKRKQKEAVKMELAEFWQSKFAKLDQSVTEQAHGPFHFLSGHNPAGLPAASKT